GVVGLRPSQGALPTAGVFPLSRTLDTVGPMAASVADTALVWSALCGRPSFSVPVAGLRVGVVRSVVTDRVVPVQATALENAVAALTSAGFVVRDHPMPDLADLARIYLDIIGPEARAVHADRVVAAPDEFEPEVLSRLTKAAEIRGWQYVAALRERDALREVFPDRFGADLLVLPTVPVQAPPIGVRDADLGAGWTDPTSALLAFNSPWSVLGVPAISVPVGVPGATMPGSVQLVGRAGGEDQLLTVAAALVRFLR
ncbi:MAG TPA: amidase family protein, partial [Pseudonocardiaceae bacterium]